MLVLLGPQRFRPTLRDTVRSLGIEGPLAVITAGWQERESEHKEMREHVDREVIDLLLYHRADDVLLRDRELARALRERQERLVENQALYRLRLAHVLASARELLARPGDGRLLEDHRRAAIRAVRALDREHVARVERVHEEIEAHWHPSRRPAVARHREQLGRILDRAGALGIAGGHVAVLVGRMRMFDLKPLIRIPVIAWSAGAMAVSERVVLFHDSPPQGPGDAEVLDAGLGLAPSLVALPHARRRLRLEDPVRVALFSRRFAPAKCALLDEGDRLDWDGEKWSPSPGALGLGGRGELQEIQEL